MKISVETLTGKTVNLDVNLFDTIETIKAKIQDKVGTQPLFLISDSTQLLDNRTLSSYFIHNDNEKLTIEISNGPPPIKDVNQPEISIPRPNLLQNKKVSGNRILDDDVIQQLTESCKLLVMSVSKEDNKNEKISKRRHKMRNTKKHVGVPSAKIQPPISKSNADVEFPTSILISNSSALFGNVDNPIKLQAENKLFIDLIVQLTKFCEQTEISVFELTELIDRLRNVLIAGDEKKNRRFKKRSMSLYKEVLKKNHHATRSAK